MQLILASTSEYRKALLARIVSRFECAPPDVDETPVNNETAPQLAERLAQAKAKAVAKDYSESHALVIGSDQVACVDGKILGKPGNFNNAFKQLSECSGKTVTFYTGLSLVNTKNTTCETTVETFSVSFRNLTPQQITHYLKYEEPYNCAGSFKSEGMGVSLFTSMDGDDPNTLIGLPLIKLTKMLADNGYDVFAHL